MIKNIDTIIKLLANSINMINNALYPSVFSLICKSINIKKIGGSQTNKKISLNKYF